MNIKLSPKAQLEYMWKKIESQYDENTTQPPFCLRCGQSMDKRLVVNAQSRYADIKICSCCGTDEAMRDWNGNPLPLLEWHAVKNSLPTPEDKTILLTTACSFSDIFEKTATKERIGYSRPVSELAYSRSDYDGYRWWSTWFTCCQKEQISQMQCQEIDEFHDALFKMPEFKTLDTMRRLCLALPTKSPDEFSLYSETAHLYIWLRLITRFRDYNLYVHYYSKNV